MRNGAPTIYEAAAEFDDTLILADILTRNPTGWTVIEVKSSTRVEHQHVPDVALQMYVLRGAGIPVNRAEILHLNRHCRYPDLADLFVRHDLTAKAEEALLEVGPHLGALREILAEPMPEVEPGPHCTDPHACPFLDRCRPAPEPNSLETLHRPRPHQLECLRAFGFDSLPVAPEDLLPTRIQGRQRRAAVRDGVVVEPGLADALAVIERPTAFLGFGTVSPAIPRWDGCRPFDRIVTGISVHTEHEDGRLTHTEWVAGGPQDPRGEAARKIVEYTSGARSVLVYHQSFEAGRIRDLMEAIPQAKDDLRHVLDRMVDLLPIVRENVYHPRFLGSFRLTRVLPALVPDLVSDDLPMRDGETARATLALARLLDRLRDLAGAPG